MAALASAPGEQGSMKRGASGEPQLKLVQGNLASNKVALLVPHQSPSSPDRQ